MISLIAVPGALKQNNPIFETSRCTFLNSRNIKGNNSDHNFGLITRDYLPAKTIGSSTMNKVPSFVEKQSMHPEMKGMSQNIKLKKATQKYGSISLYNQTSVEKGIYSIPVYYYPSLKYQLQINEKKIHKIDQSQHGFMQIKLDRYLHKNSKIIITYDNPKIYNILLIISLILYLIAFVYLLKSLLTEFLVISIGDLKLKI